MINQKKFNKFLLGKPLVDKFDLKEKLPEDDTDEALAPKNRNNNYKKIKQVRIPGSRKSIRRALLEKQTSFGFYFKTHEK